LKFAANFQRIASDCTTVTLDFGFLFDNAYDGIDESEAAQELGMSSLAFNDWFKPFSDEPSRIAHPYVI